MNAMFQDVNQTCKEIHDLKVEKTVIASAMNQRIALIRLQNNYEDELDAR